MRPDLDLVGGIVWHYKAGEEGIIETIIPALSILAGASHLFWREELKK